MIRVRPISRLSTQLRDSLLCWIIYLVIGGLTLNVKAGNSMVKNKVTVDAKVEKADKEKGKETEKGKTKETEKDKERRNIDPMPNYEETTVTLSIRNAGTVELGAVVSGTTAYLSVIDLFSYLKIKNSVEEATGNMSGFIVNPADTYTIDISNNHIRYQDKDFYLTNSEMIRSGSTVFLCTSCFKDVFMIECTFFIRTLAVNLNTAVDLPLMREIRQDEMRKAIRKIKGEFVADTSIRSKNPAFHLGIADWGFTSTHMLNSRSYTQVNITLGGYFAWGETNVGINYYSGQPFQNQNLYYRWRHVNNENKVLRQVVLGKINSDRIASIFTPVIGVQLTNSPTTFRKFFGTYTLNDRTEPGWTVELYVNNTLVEYVTADASGFFTFQVPMAYGNTEVKLRFFGPYGEEKSRVITIQVPFTFVPKNECEYTLGAGFVEDSAGVVFYRGNINYGLTKNITIGGGNEYLSSITTGKNIPFINTSFSIAGNLILKGEYAYRVRSKVLVSYRLRTGLSLELLYTKYEKGQRAIYYNYLEELKAGLSLPLRFRKFSIYARLSVEQTVYPEGIKFTTPDLMLSSAFKKLSINLHTFGYLSSFGNLNLYTEFSAGYKFLNGLSITPSFRYNNSINSFYSVRCLVEKTFSKKGYFTISYDRYLDNNTQNLQLGLRFTFSFAQAAIYANNFNKQTSFSESMSGSLLLDPATSYIKASNNSKVGRGGITVLAFLDINCNGKHDEDEPKVSGLKLTVTPGGRIEYDIKDTLIRIIDMEAYSNAFLQLSVAGFDNIAWQFRKKTFSVAVEPNMMKLVEVPVSVVGEVLGMISFKSDASSKKQDRYKIFIYRNDTIPVTWIYENEDYYNYIGLTPGSYTVRPDTAQLTRLHLHSIPASHKITILPSREGVFLDNLDFTLETNEPAADAAIMPEKKPIVVTYSPEGNQPAHDNSIEKSTLKVKSSATASPAATPAPQTP